MSSSWGFQDKHKSFTYLDCSITTYCEERGISPGDCVQEMRATIFEKTKLTASAGIAPNKVSPLLLQLRSSRLKSVVW